MPYIVTTKRVVSTPVPVGEGDPQTEVYRALTGVEDVRSMRVVRSRRAVATLEEARRAARAAIPEASNPEEWNAQYEPKEAAWNHPETGGTIGPLPDGTVIEVAPIEWLDLAREVGHPGGQLKAIQPEIITVYNARQS